MAHVEGLLKVMTERKVEEGPTARGELHAGGQTTLDDGEIAHREMTVELMDVRAHLHAVRGGKRCRIDPRPGDHDHAQLRHALPGGRIGVDDLTQQAEPDTGSPTVTMQICSSGR